jgi:iron complex transport system ATP-binding protein
MDRLRSDSVTLHYGEAPAVRELSLAIPEGSITSIIGPNGCGKSTLLRALARLMRPAGGAVYLDGQLIHHLPTREVARRLGLLHQQAVPPNGLLVEDLVRRGRYPHQSFLQPPSRRDAEAVERALELTGMTALRRRLVDQLSGGQRQRAWMAMALAQETSLLLLDEPTTFLDVAYQLEVTELVQHLNAEEGRTIVLVLHDVNEAAKVSHRIVAMRDGQIVREGTPREILEPDLLAALYGVACDVYPHRATGQPICVPRSADAHMTDGHTAAPGFAIQRLRTGYGRTVVIDDLSLELPAGSVTAIVGPNACGKSTLLRTCARLLQPQAGRVRLGDREVHRGSHRALARELALLAQGPIPPAGFLVEDLVAAGRLPHQRFWQQWRAADEAAVEAALARCDLGDLRHREVATLSGGQRQRAWVGMALAQETPVLLLDEPTTFLDLAAQIDLLDLVRALNREEGRTVVMILHDLNLAARYADWLVAMKDGAVAAAGPPAAVISDELLREVFAIEAEIIADPRTGAPLVLPLGTHERGLPDAVPITTRAGAAAMPPAGLPRTVEARRNSAVPIRH